MIDPRTVLMAIALSVAVAALLVAARFVWCLVDALRARRFGIAAFSVTGVVTILVLLATVVVVWFGYAVAHTGKNTRTDLIVLFSTVPPFLLASIGLWLLGGKLRSLLRFTENRRRSIDTEAQPQDRP